MLLIVGLDGADFQILDRLGAEGQLPNLTRLGAEGLRADLLSTLPVATLPAWTSFMTACEPARHGVADLMVRHGYDLVPATGALRCEPTWMARLSAMGMAVACLGMPGTYPPKQAGGWCIAGFDAPGVRGADADCVWPPELAARLAEHGGWRYATFNEHQPGTAHLRGAVDALIDDLDRKERLALALLRERPWDVFCIHLQASDTAAHHLWHLWDPTSPRHTPGLTDLLPRVYARLDAFIGRLLGAAPEARSLVVSDHGMGGADTVAVHINAVLRGLGLLHFAPHPARRALGALLRGAAQHLPGASAAWAYRSLPRALRSNALRLARGDCVAYGRSLAFSDELDFSPSVWLNRRDVFAEGTVNPNEAAALCTRITDALLQLRHPHSGQPLVAHVHQRDSLPPGRHAERLPDLLIEPAWVNGYRPSFLPSATDSPLVRLLQPAEYSAGKGAGMPGVHRRAGVFLAHGTGLPSQRLKPLHIAQAGAFIYPLIGMAPPQDVDARLPEFLASLGGSTVTADGANSATDEAYTPTQSAALRQRLEDMGYI